MGIEFSHAIGFRNTDGEYNILQTMGVTRRVELLARFRLDKLCWEVCDDDALTEVESVITVNRTSIENSETEPYFVIASWI